MASNDRVDSNRGVKYCEQCVSRTRLVRRRENRTMSSGSSLPRSVSSTMSVVVVSCLLFFLFVSICDGATSTIAAQPSAQTSRRVLATNHRFTDRTTTTTTTTIPKTKLPPRHESGRFTESNHHVKLNNGTRPGSPISRVISTETERRRHRPSNPLGSSTAYQWPSSFYSRDVPLYPQTQATGDQCDLPQVIGSGPYRIPRWYFNSNTRRCELFYYSGCCGNGNNFPTYEACQLICEVDPCTQNRDPGVGSLQIPRFFFNRASKLCEPFTYFGSGGNRNNFASTLDCRTKCPESPNPCAYGEPMRQGGGSGASGFLPCGFGTMVTNACPMHFYCHVGSALSTTVCCPKPAGAPERCQQPQRSGVGGEAMSRWYFEQFSQECKQFEYKGLQGNENNFLSKSDCENTCFVNPCSAGQPLRSGGHLVQCQLTNGQPTCPDRHYCHIGIDARSTVCCPSQGDPCRQSISAGKGRSISMIARWAYDSAARSCRRFNYTGLGGNENNFMSEASCKSACKVFTNVCPSGQPALSASGLPTPCKKASDDCPYGYWCHVGTSVETTMCCPGSHPSPCLGEPNPGTGVESVSRWFYDVRTYKCLPFTYMGMGGNQNNFVSKESCLQHCPEILNPCPVGEPVMEPGPGGFVLPLSCNPNSPRGFCPPNNWCHVGDSEESTMCCPRTSGQDSCQLPMALGNGRSQLQRWYFNQHSLACQQFSYTGVRGNENNFVTKDACETKCPVFRNPCLGGPVQTDGITGRPKTCTSMVAGNPCGQGYYCHVGGSQETTVCCPSVGTPCDLPLTVGVGSHSLARFYFNPMTRQCLSFQYRGTHGNDNNFLTEASCAAQCPGGQMFPNVFVTDDAAAEKNALATVWPKSDRKNCIFHIAQAQWRWLWDSKNRILKDDRPQLMLDFRRIMYSSTVFVNPCTDFDGGNQTRRTGVRASESRPMPCGHARSCPNGYWCHVGASVDTTVCCRLPQDVRAQESRCEQPLMAGGGTAGINRWYFNANSRQCLTFQYKGLYGNGNNFLTKDECEQACPAFMNACTGGQPYLVGNKPQWCGPTASPCPATYWCHVGASVESTMCCPQARNPCEVPYTAGTGAVQLARWYFDFATRTCQQFQYRGLQGNPNNFMTKDDCENACPVFENPCPNGPPATGATGRPQLCNPRNAHSGSSCPATYWCHGGATAETTVCCPAKQDPCQLSMSAGQGNYALPRWYFDSTERLCKPFSYRGSKGNSNNFMSPDECMTVCPVFIDPCPSTNVTMSSVGKRLPPVILYCSAAVAAAVSSVHHHHHHNQRHSPSQERAASSSNVCPPNYWCHIGADSKTTICCPNAISDPCKQPQNRGVGTLSLSRYYFDTTSQQCYQFSYSGLGGNQNNFLTLAQCEKECPVFTNPCRRGEPLIIGNRPQLCSVVQPCPPNYWCHCGAMAETTLCCPAETNEPCVLPMEPGVGGSALARWYYSNINRQCIQFSYQGLRGNQNNFLTREDCERTCRVNPCLAGEPATGNGGAPLQCTLGSTCPAAYWCHYGESAQTTVCCPGATSNACELPQLAGSGSASLNRFYYNAMTRDCVPFVYRGSGGNQNNFLSVAECRTACPGTPNPCRAGEPPRDANGRYQQCSSSVANFGRSACPANFWCHPGADQSTTVCCPGAENPCVLPVLPGTGDANVPRWYYNSMNRQCVQFQYRGLGGNQNNFLTEQDCARACPVMVNPCAQGQFLSLPGGLPAFCTAPTFPMNCPPGAWCHYGADRETTVCCPNAVSERDMCALEPARGRGDKSLNRWYFNPSSRRCTMFTYTGLGGNQNNYLTREECAARCPEFENPCAPPNTPLLGPDNRPVGCSFSVGCNGGYFCHLGYSPQTTICCPGALDSACGGMPPSEGQGEYSLPRWYYDFNSKTCRQFQYRGTRGNANNFQSQADCEQTCSVVKNPCAQPLPSSVPTYCSMINSACPMGQWCHFGQDRETTMCCAGAIDTPCILPLNPGFGTSQLPRYYFNPDSNQCVQFSYRGTQGNQNNFLTLQDCEQQCNPFANPCPNGDPLMSPGPAPFNRPQTCNALSTTSSCPAGYWCHVGASLDSTVCCQGAGDPCSQPVATGVGNATLPRFYYDPASRQCVQFTYSGTKGNQNNFASMEACRMSCRESRNPCIGQPAVTPTGQTVFCSATNKDSCPVNFWCHIGSAAETTLCCPGATNPCSVPLSPGTGSDNLQRFYYNSDSRTCVSFVYNGLGGNQNNFLTRSECEATCPVFVNPCMGGPPAVGRASAPLQCNPAAAGASGTAACPASYWCHVGNSPQSTVCCPSAVDKPCVLAKSVGRGLDKSARWYFDTISRKCQQFEYTGLGGNQNNFMTQTECQRVCQEAENPCLGEPERDDRGQPKLCLPFLPMQCGFGYFCHTAGPGLEGPNVCCPAIGELCEAPKMEGEGDAVIPRWYFDNAERLCSQFSYRGRKGNQNSFMSQEECIRRCQPDVNPCMAGDLPLKHSTRNVQCLPDKQSCPITHYCHVGDDSRSTVCCPRRGSPCQQPSHIGSGSAKLNRWFYSPQQDECLTFTYSGRGGNENNFLTRQDCDQTCPGFRGLCPHSKPPIVKGQAQECGIETPCQVNFVCHINTLQSKSICCPDPATFCVLPRDPGPCSNFTTHYGYSRETGTCVPFKYGGCAGNENNFISLERCTEVCCDKGF